MSTVHLDDPPEQPACTPGRGVPRCGRCRRCRWLRLLASRPDDRDVTCAELRCQASLHAQARLAVGVYDGAVLARGWEGYAVELVMVAPDDLPVSAHSPTVLDLRDAYPSFDRPLAVIRYRLWRPDQRGYLQVVWDHQAGEQYSIHDFDAAQQAEARRLLDLARVRPAGRRA